MIAEVGLDVLEAEVKVLFSRLQTCMYAACELHVLYNMQDMYIQTIILYIIYMMHYTLNFQ